MFNKHLPIELMKALSGSDSNSKFEFQTHHLRLAICRAPRWEAINNVPYNTEASNPKQPLNSSSSKRMNSVRTVVGGYRSGACPSNNRLKSSTFVVLK